MTDFNNFGGLNSSAQYSPALEEAKLHEKKSLLKNASILGILLICYELFNKVTGYIFYFIFVSIRTKAPVLSWSKVQDYFSDKSWLLKSSTFGMGYSVFVVGLSLICLLLMAKFVFGIKLGRIFRFEKGQTKTILTCFPAVMSVNIITSFVIAIITFYYSQNGITIPEADFSITSNTLEAYILQIAYGVVAAPIIEETLYRGLAIHLLKPYGKGMAVIVSSLIFGLMHGNFAQATSGFCFALVMGTIAVSCNSIVPTIFIHMLNNLVAQIPDFYDSTGNELFYNIYLAIIIVSLVLGSLVIFAYHKKI